MALGEPSILRSVRMLENKEKLAIWGGLGFSYISTRKFIWKAFL